MTAPLIDDLVDELSDIQVSCDGCSLGSHYIRDCDNPAEFVISHDHGCPLIAPLKCAGCVKLHMQDLANAIEGAGRISCYHCDREFWTIPSFVQYRPIS